MAEFAMVERNAPANQQTNQHHHMKNDGLVVEVSFYMLKA
jgi:hypothetical protein